ncbi:MAG: hypothetical protein ACI4CT_01375 [Lachnospiraceae bacterium]
MKERRRRFYLFLGLLFIGVLFGSIYFHYGYWTRNGLGDSYYYSFMEVVGNLSYRKDIILSTVIVRVKEAIAAFVLYCILPFHCFCALAGFLLGFAFANVACIQWMLVLN